MGGGFNAFLSAGNTFCWFAWQLMQIMSVTISKLQYLRLCGTRECACAAAVTCAACCLGLSQPKGGRADWKPACHRCFSLLARLLFVSSNFGWMSYNKVVFIIFSNDDTMAWQSVIFVEEGKILKWKTASVVPIFHFLDKGGGGSKIWRLLGIETHINLPHPRSNSLYVALL